MSLRRGETVKQSQWIRYCHCVHYRKVTGSAFVTGLMYRAEEVRWTRFKSSLGVLRVFCQTCGDAQEFRQLDAPEKDCLMLGTFNDPSLIEVDGNVEHIFADRELNLCTWITRVEDQRPTAFADNDQNPLLSAFTTLENLRAASWPVGVAGNTHHQTR